MTADAGFAARATHPVRSGPGGWLMAVGLNIVVGYAGLLDLGYVAFYAMGAYTAAWFASPQFANATSTSAPSASGSTCPGIHISIWLLVSRRRAHHRDVGVLIGLPTLRLRGDYLAIVTLGFGEILPVFKNLVGVNFSFGPIKLENANLTGGAVGINPIDPPSFFGLDFGATSGQAAVYLAMIIVGLCLIIARNLERSRMGRAWMAIREDELAAEMMGVNTVRTKLLAFGLGASFAGVAGALQASYLGATTSDFFMFSTSILVLIMIILGGIGNIWGVMVGALALVYVDKTFLLDRLDHRPQRRRQDDVLQHAHRPLQADDGRIVFDGATSPASAPHRSRSAASARTFQNIRLFGR
jgi:branched-chain amino acid transport system permease protein